jgi:long-chain fatty acid transport protein
MKKSFLFSLALTVLGLSVFAGGIVTNANQSAAYIRMLCRDASRNIDAVYYNPAGLSFLSKGFHLSINNQSITQNRTITNNYRYLNSYTYTGEVSAPLFPGVYAAYNTGNLVISAGFNPIGGGGSATFTRGLPSFEMAISELVPGLQAIGQPVTAYSTNIMFKGESIYWGAQLGATYKVNDMVSVFAGGRYVMASTTYTGYIKSNTIYFGSTAVSAPAFFTQLKNSATAAVTQFSALPAAMVLPASYATAAGLPVGITAGAAVVALTASAKTAGAKAILLADQEADVTQKGNGFAPILGLDLNLMEKKLNLGFKYEFKTKMETTNHTNKDVLTGFNGDGSAITQFPDGKKISSDMPAMLSIGASYQLCPKMLAAVGFHTYFDKQANYGKQLDGVYVDNSTLMDHNYWELSLGLEYKINDKVLISGGYLRAQTGVKPIYQTDLSNSLSSNTVGVGFAYNITPKIVANVGFLATGYDPSDKNFTRTLGTTTFPIVEVYEKDNTIFSFGFDFTFGK